MKQDQLSEIISRLQTLEAELQSFKKFVQGIDAEGPHYVSTQTAAKMLGCPAGSIKNHFKSGRLTRYKLGGLVRIDRDELLKMIKQEP